MVYHILSENEMAILHRNPMPLNGALFVTNPRRKNSRRKRNGLSMRRNALSQRRNALAKLRRNAEMIQGTLDFDAPAVAKPKSKPKTKSKSTSKGNGMTRKEIMAQLDKEGVTYKKSAKKGTLQGLLTRTLNAKKSSSKKSSKGSGRFKAGQKTEWGKFLQLTKGASLTAKQQKALFAKYKADKTATTKKINDFKAKVKTAAAKLKGQKVGRGYLRKGRKSVLADTAFLNNPLKKINPRRRKNVGIAGVQPLAMPLAIVQDTQQAAQNIPVVKFVSFAITPLALGAAVYGVHKLAEPHIMKIVEDLQVEKIPVLKETLKFPYTTTGVVAGLVLGILAKNNILAKNAASMVAASAVSVGIGLDLSLRSFAKAATEVTQAKVADVTAEAAVVVSEAVEAAEAGVPLSETAALANGASANGDMGAIRLGAIHQNPHCYGDGGQYMIGRSSQALGSYGAVHMGSATGLAKDAEYQDASPADAKACTCVMMPDEVAAAKAGRMAYKRKFGTAPRNKRKTQSLMSRHAGRAGHRFGWLIKMIGFENFQKIASLPPKRREIVISQLQKQAIASIPALVQAQQAQNASLETASLPVQGAMNGVQGFQGVGYGAMMFAGQGY